MRCKILNTRDIELCSREWMLLKTTIPCSISAMVVPTGWLGFWSLSFSNEVCTTPLPASTKNPSSWYSTDDGGLKGMGMASLRTSSTSAPPSISTTSVGWTLSVCPPGPPFSLSSVGMFWMCAESSNALSAPVAAPLSPPIMCVRPMG